MKPHSMFNPVWPTIALLSHFIASVNAGYLRHDLLIRDGVTVGQLYPDDVKNQCGYYPMDPTDGNRGQAWLFTCHGSYPVSEWSEGGIRYVACCNSASYKTVLGTISTKLLCCAQNEHHSGTATTGYACCSNGYIYQDGTCKPVAAMSPPPVPVSTDQQPLVNDHLPHSPGTAAGNTTGQNSNTLCSSGVVTGKKYWLVNRDGTYWGFTHDSDYWSMGQAYKRSFVPERGTFRFCTNEACISGISIDPPDSFSIKDIHENPPTGTKADLWLHNYARPDRLTRTYQYDQAGRFSITKWSGGMYCIGSAAPTGQGSIYPDRRTLVAFAEIDLQVCVEVELIEVPETVDSQIPPTPSTVTIRSTDTQYVTKTETVLSCPQASPSSSTVSSIVPTPSASGSFTCNATAYLIAETAGVVSLYNIDLSTGKAIKFATNVGAGIYKTMNALGYNTRDNYLYAVGARKEGDFAVVRITTTGALTEMLRFASDAAVGIADFDTNGQLWLSGASPRWWQVDLLPGSATYAKIVNTGTYTLSGYAVADWSYLPGQGNYMYALAMAKDPAPHMALLKWSLSSHTWSVHQSFNTGAMATGWLVASWGGSSGKIWVMSASSGKLTQLVLGQTPTAHGTGPSGLDHGDGARCVLAN